MVRAVVLLLALLSWGAHAATIIQTYGITSEFVSDASPYSTDITSGATAGNSLVVAVNSEFGYAITAVTFEGSAMSAVWQGGPSGDNSKGIFRIDGLVGGENTIAVSFTGGTGRIGIMALEVQGLGANDYIGSWAASPEGNSTSHTIPFTAGASGVLAVGLAMQVPTNTTTYSATSPVFVRHAGTAPTRAAMIYRDGAPAGAGTLPYTIDTTDTRLGVAVTFLEASGGPTIPKFSHHQLYRTQ